MTDPELNAITERIIGCAFAVSNGLGTGFLERVYLNALVHELRKAGLKADQERPVDVTYDGVMVGCFQPDILVEDTVLVELKATKDHDDLSLRSA